MRNRLSIVILFLASCFFLLGAGLYSTRSHGTKIVSKTANYTLKEKECGRYGLKYIFNNDGASGTVTLTLVAATVNSDGEGLTVHFSVVDAHTFNINPNGTDRILYLTDSAGDSIEASTAGSFVTLVCEADGYWTPKGRLGFTDAN